MVRPVPRQRDRGVKRLQSAEKRELLPHTESTALWKASQRALRCRRPENAFPLGGMGCHFCIESFRQFALRKQKVIP